jgi:pyruvyltransferase
VKVYWARAGGGRNFGDSLAPRLLAHFGIEAEWARPRRAQLLSIGSVIHQAYPRWRGVVLGTGSLRPDLMGWLSHARVLAVRGALTRDGCELPASTPLGDPGILVTDLFRVRRRNGPVAIAPHHVDDDMARRHPGAPRIDMLADHAEVMRAIARSRLVITSSLHALIAADALGVPHILEPHPAVIGGLHKFTDYASAFGDTITPGVERLTDRHAMRERQALLRDCYRNLLQ